MINTLARRIIVLLLLSYIILYAKDSFAKIDTDTTTTILTNKIPLKKKGSDIKESSDIYEKTAPGRMFPKILLTNPETAVDYTESTFRRFDIIFFLALPVFIAYQYIIHEVVSSYYPVNGRAKNEFFRNQYLYIGLSSVMLGITVAYNDYRKVNMNGTSNLSSSYYSKNANNKSISLMLHFDF